MLVVINQNRTYYMNLVILQEGFSKVQNVNYAILLLLIVIENQDW